jgi:hypothetical protein
MTTKLEGAAFVGAAKLKNGSVVFDCKDDVTAKWLKGPGTMAQFVAALGGSCMYKPRRVEPIAEMMPIEARIEDPGTWRAVERDSGLRDGEITGARWVKAPHCRSLSQRVAHLKVEFATAESANHAIDNGIYYQGQH